MVDSHKNSHTAHHTGPFSFGANLLSQAFVQTGVQQANHSWKTEPLGLELSLAKSLFCSWLTEHSSMKKSKVLFETKYWTIMWKNLCEH